MEVVKVPDSIRQEHLTALMEEYEKELLGVCCAYLRDIHLAEDAVQETFLKAYRAMSCFRGECSEHTWLMRIAINTCRDMRRSAWLRYVDRSVTLDSLPEPAAPAADHSLDVTRAIMGLPRKEMEVMLLYYYQGMTVTDIGQALSLSVSAVSGRLTRGRKRLQSLLKGVLDDA